MKKNQIIKLMALLAIMLVGLVPLSIAEEGNDDEVISEEDAGTTPDSALYGLDKAMDRIRLAFIFDKAKKAEANLRVSQERLAELKLMIEEGKTEDALKSRLEYEDSIRKSELELEQMSADGDSEKAKEALEKLARLRNQTEDHMQKVARVHEDILEKLENKMTPEQYEELKQLFARIENSTTSLDVKLQAKKDAAVIKYKVLSGKSETEIEVELEDLDRKSGLDDSRRHRAEHNIERASEAIAKAELRLKNSNLTSEEKAEIESHIELLKQILSEANLSMQNRTRDSQELGKYAREFGNEVSEIAKLLGESRLNMTNATFDRLKERLKIEIRERHDENKERVIEKLKERAKEEDGESRIRIEKRIGQIGEIKVRYEERIKDGEIRTRLKAELEEGKYEDKYEEKYERKISPCPMYAIESCANGFNLEIYELNNGCKIQKCVSKENRTSGVCPLHDIASCRDGFELIETKLDSGCTIKKCVEQTRKEIKPCPLLAIEKCQEGYVLKTYDNEDGCSINKCVRDGSDDFCEPAIMKPCLAGQKSEDFRDGNGCKYYKCVADNSEDDDSGSGVVCPALEMPACEAGYEVEDFKDGNGCKYYKCVFND